MRLTATAEVVLKKRYLRKEKGEAVETPAEMLERVAGNIAMIDAQYGADVKQVEDTKQKFIEMLDQQKFMPNSPTLMNAGTALQQLAACFVLPVEDSMESIFESIKQAAIIHKSGGGTGFAFSRLRPSNDSVQSTGGVASGPVSFMRVFNAATEAVKQGGVRRGANMGILRVDHPDILEFINCKQENDQLTNFNISVAITDTFMQAVQDKQHYDLINPRNGDVVQTLYAPKVFDLVVDRAWKNGEPGIVFIDRINDGNPTPALGAIESTNPCGEQPLLPYESCNLGSINLGKFVNNGIINWDDLADTVHTSVHFLDNVIDANDYPLERIAEVTRSNRKIGLGVMGFADMLMLMGIAYNSQEAVDMAAEVMGFINRTSKEASINLAQKRGPFPNFAQSIYSDGPPLRNATTTTIAPTGTISIIAGASSGIEPLFALAFVRNVLDDDRLVDVHPTFAEIMREQGLYTDEIMEQVALTGSLEGVANVPDELRKIMVIAHDVSPNWHIKIQAAFQAQTDNAVSKTVNFSHNASREQVAEVFLSAYDYGLKGITIYRDGSRDSQVLEAGTKERVATAEVMTMPGAGLPKIKPRQRPEEVTGLTKKYKIGGCGKLYVTVNEDEHGICEIFTNTGGEGCAPLSDSVSRLISIALRAGVHIDAILNQLKGIRCVGCIVDNDTYVLSCPDAIGKTIEKMVKGSNRFDLNILGGPVSLMVCPEPDCGGIMVPGDGCHTCPSCGYSKCG